MRLRGEKGGFEGGGGVESLGEKNTSSSPLIVEIILHVAKSFIRTDHQSLKGLSISGKREPEIGLKVGGESKSWAGFKVTLMESG